MHWAISSSQLSHLQTTNPQSAFSDFGTSHQQRRSAMGWIRRPMLKGIMLVTSGGERSKLLENSRIAQSSAPEWTAIEHRNDLESSLDVARPSGNSNEG